MSKFVLTAQLQLQAPTNVRQVVNQIQSQLNNVNVNVQLQNATKTQTQLNSLSKSADQTATAFNQMGKNFGNAVRRFSALAIATRAVSLFTNTLSKAIQESINFERELVKVAQVTGNTLNQLKFLSNTITDLSTSLGVGSTSLLNVSRILSQAGLSAQETQIALSTLARTELAPTFDDITQTAEGAVAIFNQFGQGAAALEAQLGSVNAVAGKFAVEAGDLISTIRRTGGVFRASGGDLNELIALFTSVRATTRESAESIATGLRTIFTRIQRPKTIEFLRQYGVELTDLEGKFVGPYEAVRKLSQAFAGLEQGDLTFVQIAEELGGFRQIGKVIPLLQQFKVAQEALNVAQQGSGSLAADAASAQIALAVKITKVKEEFLALVRAVTETSTFRIMANTALTLASSFVKVADALKPLIPIITAFAGIKLATGIGGFLGGLSGKGFNQGGKVHAFATGGIVPGSGNSDTVPAMLTPGEFVIKKSSVKSLGAGNLTKMNAGGEVQKFAKGGIVVNPGAIGGFFLTPEQGDPRKFSFSDREVQITNKSALSQLGYADTTKGLSDEGYFFKSDAKQKAKILGRGSKVNKFLQDIPDNPTQAKIYIARAQKGDKNQQTAAANFNEDFAKSRKKLKEQRIQTGPQNIPLSGGITGYFPGRNDLENSAVAQEVRRITKDAMYNTVLSSATSIASGLDGAVPKIALNTSFLRDGASRSSSDPQALRTVEGYIFEGIINSLTGASLSGGTTAFDFPASSIAASKSGLKQLFTSSSGEGVDQLLKADAKRSASTDAFNSIVNKIVQDLNKGDFGGVSFKKFASGGAASGTDTVPAMLTPGEFVVNRASAQQIGYGNLNRMNKVGKYAQGGVVRGGVQYLANGGTAGGGGAGLFAGVEKTTGALIGLNVAVASLTPTIDETSSTFQKTVAGGLEVVSSLSSLALSVSTVANLMNTKLVTSLLTSSSGLGKFRGASIDFLKAFRSGKSGSNFIKGTPNVSGLSGGLIRSFGTRLGSVVRLLSNFVGPLKVAAVAIAGLSIVDGLVGGFRDLQGSLDDALKAQDSAKAQQLAISKANADAIPIIGNLVGAFADVVGGSESLTTFLTYFGGESVSSIKANIDAQVQASKSQKILEQNTKKISSAFDNLSKGTGTLQEVFDSLGPVLSQFGAESQAIANQIEAKQGERSTGAGAILRNIGAYAGGGLFGMETAGTRNKRLDRETKDLRESRGKVDQKTIEQAGPALRILQKRIIATGGSFSDFQDAVEGTPELKPVFDALIREGFGPQLDQFKNLQKESDSVTKKLKALNLGLSSATGAAAGLEARLAEAQQIRSGVSATDSLSVLKTSTTSGALGIDPAMQRRASNQTANLLRSFGASEAQVNKFTTGVENAYAAQKNAPKVLKDFTAKLRAQQSAGTLQAKDINAETFLDEIIKSIGLTGAEEKIFKDGIDLSKIDPEKLLADDFSGITDALGERAQKLFEQVDPIAKAQEAYEKQVIEAANSLDAALDSRLNAFKAQIDLQVESAQLISKFGGQRFTARDQFSAESRKLDLGLQRTGLGPTGGDPQAISRAFQEINRELQQLGQIDRTQLSTAESADVDARTKELNTANERLLSGTRSLIKVKQEELRVIQEKNRLEKSSLEALLAGDEEKFEEGLQTQGAIAAIRSGQTEGISADVLNRAFQELKRQFEAGVASREEVQQAALATAQARGFGPREAAEIAARVTGGGAERGVEGEIRSLASTLPLAGDSMQTAADIQLRAAEMFYDAVERSKPQSVRESRRYERGGVVYASQGQYVNFKPRGTDTVPAMLSPGEFVVNAQATKANRSTLEAINSGKSPQYASMGGIIGPKYLADGTDDKLSPEQRNAENLARREERKAKAEADRRRMYEEAGVDVDLLDRVMNRPSYSEIRKQKEAKEREKLLEDNKRSRFKENLEKREQEAEGSTLGYLGDVAGGFFSGLLDNRVTRTAGAVGQSATGVVQAAGGSIGYGIGAAAEAAGATEFGSALQDISANEVKRGAGNVIGGGETLGKAVIDDTFGTNIYSGPSAVGNRMAAEATAQKYKTAKETGTTIAVTGLDVGSSFITEVATGGGVLNLANKTKTGNAVINAVKSTGVARKISALTKTKKPKPTPVPNTKTPARLVAYRQLAAEAGVPSEVIDDAFETGRILGGRDGVEYVESIMGPIRKKANDLKKSSSVKPGGISEEGASKLVKKQTVDAATQARTKEVENLLRDQELVGNGGVTPRQQSLADQRKVVRETLQQREAAAAATTRSRLGKSTKPPIAERSPVVRLTDAEKASMLRRPRPIKASASAPPPMRGQLPQPPRRPTAATPPPLGSKTSRPTRARPQSPLEQALEGDVSIDNTRRLTSAELEAVGATAQEISAAKRFEYLQGVKKKSYSNHQLGKLLRQGVDPDAYFEMLENPPTTWKDALAWVQQNSNARIKTDELFGRSGIGLQRYREQDAELIRDFLESGFFGVGFERRAKFLSGVFNRPFDIAPSSIPKFAKGGMIYANNGMLVPYQPRGTDTIPAMLTPGEFVVNAGAVKRGNNIAVLQAMNKGQSPSAGSGVQNFARGGVVRYRANGSNGPEAGGGVAVGTPALDSSVVDKFASAVDKFNESVLASIEQLSNTSISLRLEPTNININLTGTEALRSITASVKQELLNVVQAKLSNLRVDNGGNIVDSAGSII